MGRAGPRPPPGPGGEAGRSARRRRQPDAGMRAFAADSHRISGRQLFGAPLGELGGPGITSRTQAVRPDGRVEAEDGAADPNSTRESQGPGHPRVRRGQGRRRPAGPAARSTSQPRTAWSAGSQPPAPDEVGHHPLERDGANLAFQTPSKRHDKGSALPISNKSLSERDQAFGDDTSSPPPSSTASPPPKAASAPSADTASSRAHQPAHRHQPPVRSRCTFRPR
jgi:hypothetical protein